MKYDVLSTATFQGTLHEFKFESAKQDGKQT